MSLVKSIKLIEKKTSIHTNSQVLLTWKITFNQKQLEDKADSFITDVQRNNTPMWQRTVGSCTVGSHWR